MPTTVAPRLVALASTTTSKKRAAQCTYGTTNRRKEIRNMLGYYVAIFEGREVSNSIAASLRALLGWLCVPKLASAAEIIDFPADPPLRQGSGYTLRSAPNFAIHFSADSSCP